MGVYLRAKFEVSSIILTGFRLGGVILPPPPPQNEPLKSPPRLGLICIFSCGAITSIQYVEIKISFVM